MEQRKKTSNSPFTASASSSSNSTIETALITPLPHEESEHCKYFWTNIHKDTFQEIINDAKMAISLGILPIRIGKGSSGSYFIKNTKGKVIGVFKPKDEEPYGINNPNWKKKLQRVLFPCFFGRSW